LWSKLSQHHPRLGLIDRRFERVGRRNVLDGGVAGVLSEGQGNFLESVGESTHGVLLDTLNLVGLGSNGDGAGEFGGTAATNNVVVTDHVTDDADGVVEAASSLVTNRAGTATNEDSNSL